MPWKPRWLRLAVAFGLFVPEYDPSYTSLVGRVPMAYYRYCLPVRCRMLLRPEGGLQMLHLLVSQA